MGFLRRKIEGMMTQGNGPANGFASPLEWTLYGCSRAYELAMALRAHLYDRGVLQQKSLPCKVMSIGNITVGGTGKTPMVCYVASLLKGLGLEVAVISRGYRGRAQHSGGIVSDGTTRLMEPEASGDEPQLLASKLEGISVLVGKDRYRAGQLAIRRFGSAVLVLDDGFQHLPLKRDLDLLLLDSMRPFGNGCLIPMGPLREPMAQIRRASAFVLTRWTRTTNASRESSMIRIHGRGRPVFKCNHVPESLHVAGGKEALPWSSLKGRRVFAFSGIGRNDSFRETIGTLEAHLAGFAGFTDHHRYSTHDLSSLWKRARDLQVDSIITTEKDFVNICGNIPPAPQLLVLSVSISFGDDRERFDNYVKDWALSP